MTYDQSGTETAETSLSRLRKDYEAYLTTKKEEIDEAIEAWRYYHGVQWSREQVSVLAKRKQPIITFNRTTPKIDGLIGTIRRLRTDPKAFPRNNDDEEAATLATLVLRYGADVSNFEDIEAEACRFAATIGIGGCEMELTPSEQGDYDVLLKEVDPREFFYDPRSIKSDFSDARYMGTTKWVSKEEVEELFPGQGDSLPDSSSSEFTSDFDNERKAYWTDTMGRFRLVSHWYRKGGRWYYCIYVGTKKLESGVSPFTDDKGKSICPFLMWSNAVDHEGDRYGFCRLMKGPQDAINMHRSKAVHAMNTRQMKVRKGAVESVEKLRAEAMRMDGILEYQGDASDFEVLPNVTDFAQNAQFFSDARDEIENFGPNQALLGTGIQAKSGRAMAMLQQTGLAQLGPFLKNFRMWKLRCYRALWGAYRQFWTAERWIRVTQNDNAPQFMAINQMQVDEYGMPKPVNAIGMIDVDIIIEEGPDTENVAGDVFDLLQSLAQNGVPVPPPVFIELAPLPSDKKEKLLELLNQPPDPMAEQVGQIALQAEAEKARKTGSEADNKDADTMLKRQQFEQGQALAGMAMEAMQPQPAFYG